MIDQERRSIDQLVKSSAPQLTVDSSSNRATTKPKTNPLPSAYMSRGYSMIRAALSENSQKFQSMSKTNNISNQMKSLSFVEAAQVKLQQELERGQAKKSRTKVAFRNPLVTKKYEYEQTFVPVIKSRDAEKARSNYEIPSVKSQPVACEADLNDDGSVEDYLAYEDDVEDEEEIFTMAASSFEEMEFDFSDNSITSMKRPHQLIEDDEAMEIEVKRKPDSESLFSSPKVAKIAPYFDDNEPTNPPSANQRVSTVRRSHALKSFSPQLLKFQASRRFDDRTFDIPQSSNPPNESRYPALGDWISSGLSYISNRMTKLIF